MKDVLLSWSSGKDSAWALYLLRQQRVRVAGLLTTINEAAGRVAMHGVRRSLLERQGASLGLPLWPVPLPWPCSNDQYESIMGDLCRRAAAEGIGSIAFGDLYLQDIREYRERSLRGTGLEALFPLWGLPTDQLAREMISAGLRARLTCIDPKILRPDFAGREFDAQLLQDLPHSVDACGENGEFHTFAYGGPMFEEPISVIAGEVRESSGFVYADLLEENTCPASSR